MAQSSYTSIWARADARRPRAAARRPRRFRWVVGSVLPITLITTVAIAVLLPAGLSTEGRLALFAFGLAVVLWSTTKLNAAFVALGAVMLLVLSGGVAQERLFDALASDVIWLMIGAFVLGGAVEQTGLAGRLTQLVAARARTVAGVCWLLTAVLVPLAFLLPSTSGRAAVVIPIYRSIGAAAGGAARRALALLIPTVILVSTIASLIGAGSHLIANDLLAQITGESLSFAAWALYGLPFGVAASALSCAVIVRLFLTPEQRSLALRLPDRPRRALRRSERFTVGVVVAMVALWLSESLHGLEIATVTVLGALALTLPGLGVLSWKSGLKAVSWNLVIFVGAALVLGQALIDSGAAQWIIDQAFALSGIAGGSSHLLILVALAFLSLTSHIYMTSHTARAAALVPSLLYLAMSLDVSPLAVMFIGTVGMDYCLTFPVSSKALLMFQELDGDTYQPSDLLRLSAVLLPVHLVLMLLFYYGYWQWVGLSL